MAGIAGKNKNKHQGLGSFGPRLGQCQMVENEWFYYVNHVCGECTAFRVTLKSSNFK